MNCGIYRIDNRLTGEAYIGASDAVEHRWKIHLSNLRHGSHHNAKLQAAFTECGETAFDVHILELCPRQELKQREAHWIAKICPAYNDGTERRGRPPGGSGRHRLLQVHVTAEMDRLISEFQHRHRLPKPSDAHRKLIELGLTAEGF